ncbi:MAG: hypothetical protein NVSMB25_13150 [Thermoleophilaceae bacterium]
MAIMMTHANPGMPPQIYDEIIARLIDALRQEEGFIFHCAQVSADGIIVTEVWENLDQWQGWYERSVQPHLPADAPQPHVVELHNSIVG